MRTPLPIPKPPPQPAPPPQVRSMKSGREVREEAAKKTAIEELKAARERKAKGEEAR